MDPRLVTKESAHFSQSISDFELYTANAETEKFSSTLVNNVAGQIDISIRYYQELKGKTSYHQYDHSSNIVNGIASIFLNVNNEDVFEIRQELENYNKDKSPDLRIDTFEDLFGILKIFASTHDIGHSFDLHPEIKKLMERDDISVEDFERALAELKVNGKTLEGSEYLVQLEQSNEKDAESRSKGIAAFLLKQSLSNSIQAFKTNGGSSDHDFDKTYNNYKEIIDHMINLTIYSQDEENTEPFAQIIRFLDRVMPYVGKREIDKVLLIKALCEEKEAEKISGKISVLFGLNFPWLEFHKLYKDGDTKAKILAYFAGIDIKLGTEYERRLGRFYSKADFPEFDVETPITWKEMGEFLKQEGIIKVINNFDRFRPYE